MTAAAHADWLDRLYARAPLPAWAVGAAFGVAVLVLVAVAAAWLEDPWHLVASGRLLSNRDFRTCRGWFPRPRDA